jgi:hypothetical protein
MRTSATRTSTLAGALLVGATLLACGGGGGGDGAGWSPTAPAAASDVVLTSADVVIASTSVNGATISPGFGPSTTFTVHLADPADRARVAAVWLDYPVHSGMGMSGSRSSVPCRDDGLDGDAQAADGVYSYRDVDRRVGPHAADSPRGVYRYELHGVDVQGRHTNRVACVVTVL